MATFGAGGATTSYEEFENTDLIICWGSNTMECHPIIYNHMRRGIKNGAKMIVVGPQKIDQVKKAHKWLGLNVGTDIALANAMANVIIAEDLHDKEFIERATENFEAYRDKVSGYTPEYAEQILGVPADDIREVARMYAGGQGYPQLDPGHHRAPQWRRWRVRAHRVGASHRSRQQVR